MNTTEHALSFTSTRLFALLVIEDIPCEMCIWLCQVERCGLALVVPALSLGIESILLWRVEIIWKIGRFQIFCNGCTFICLTDSSRLLSHDRAASIC